LQLEHGTGTPTGTQSSTPTREAGLTGIVRVCESG